MKLPISKLVNNTGQIEGLPANPRQIDKTDYERLLKSLKEDPDFLVHKPLHVYEHNDQYVVLGGNQRLRALKELGYNIEWHEFQKEHTIAGEEELKVIRDFARKPYQESLS